MLEDPGVLESVLACFPSLKRLSLKDNFIPQLATEEIMRRVAPHLLLAPPTTTSGSHPLTTAGNHRRHPLLALPSSSTATAALAAAASTPQGSWSCAASPASSPSRSSPPGIDDEEAEIASPIPRKRRAPAAATTTSKPTPMATSPCYTPSPATAYVGRRDPAASSGPTTPTRPRSSAASSAFAAAAASFSGTQYTPKARSQHRPLQSPSSHTHIYTKPHKQQKQAPSRHSARPRRTRGAPFPTPNASCSPTLPSLPPPATRPPTPAAPGSEAGWGRRLPASPRWSAPCVRRRTGTGRGRGRRWRG